MRQAVHSTYQPCSSDLQGAAAEPVFLRTTPVDLPRELPSEACDHVLLSPFPCDAAFAGAPLRAPISYQASAALDLGSRAQGQAWCDVQWHRHASSATERVHRNHGKQPW